jgi:Flp pilus assembly protein TadG
MDRLRDRKGQSLVEIALITPLVLIALMIPIDFAIMFNVAHHLQNSVREAARIAAATNPYDDAAMESDLQARLAGYNWTAKSVELRTGAVGCTQTVVATATISYPFFFYRMMNWFGANIQTSQTITRETRMRYGFQPVTNAGAPC